MGAAVRDVAENLQGATEAKIEQRRRNAEDAKTFGRPRAKGACGYQIDLSEKFFTDDLPRIGSRWKKSGAVGRMEAAEVFIPNAGSVP